MSALEIINQSGWRKTCSLKKGIIYIGSAPTNDIVLEGQYGAGAAPLHAQLIALMNDRPGYKLVNLSDAPITVRGREEVALPPRSVMDLTDGMQFVVGDFTLILRDEAAALSTRATTSRSIDVKIELANSRLMPHRSLEGAVVITNLGKRAGVRFNLELEGMPADCYELAPGPILSSGAQRMVKLVLYHRVAAPPAGERQIVVRVAAPQAYPGEEAVASQIIQVMPFVHHQLRLLPADGVTPLRAKTTEELPEQPDKRPASRKTPGPQDKTQDWKVVPAEASSPVRIQAAVQPEPRPEASPPAQTAETEEAQDWWTEPEEILPPPHSPAHSLPEAEAWWSAPEADDKTALEVEPRQTNTPEEVDDVSPQGAPVAFKPAAPVEEQLSSPEAEPSQPEINLLPAVDASQTAATLTTNGPTEPPQAEIQPLPEVDVHQPEATLEAATEAEPEIEVSTVDADETMLTLTDQTAADAATIVVTGWDTPEEESSASDKPVLKLKAHVSSDQPSSSDDEVDWWNELEA